MKTNELLKRLDWEWVGKFRSCEQLSRKSCFLSSRPTALALLSPAQVITKTSAASLSLLDSPLDLRSSMLIWRAEIEFLL